MTSNVLKKQLELVRFEKTMDYVMSSAGGMKRLNSSELAHLNNMLTHKTEDPWRAEETTISLPSGETREITMISNPQVQASEIINRAREEAGDGDLVEAAVILYSELVLGHLFRDANRRTAVCAASWILMEHGKSIPAMGLLELGLGDLRESGQLDALRGLVKYSIGVSKGSKL